jgi:hypothetical protein
MSIAANGGTCVRIAPTSALIQETFDPIDVTCAQMAVSVKETLLSSDKTDMKELHEQNCVPIEGTSEATAVIFDTTVGIWDLTAVIVAPICVTSIAIATEHVTTEQSHRERNR